MAAFLHVPPVGGRFNGPDLGAWSAYATLTAAAVEAAHHMRRELVARGAATLSRQFRQYSARLLDAYLHIRGQQAEFPDMSASNSHVAGQRLGERIRAEGRAGILYDSIRHAGGVNIVAYRPRNVADVAQADHFEVLVAASSRRIEVRRLPYLGRAACDGGRTATRVRSANRR